MTVQYTNNFHFPLAPDTTENWGAIINGVLEDLDALLETMGVPLEIVCFDNDIVLEDDEVIWA